MEKLTREYILNYFWNDLNDFSLINLGIKQNELEEYRNKTYKFLSKQTYKYLICRYLYELESNSKNQCFLIPNDLTLMYRYPIVKEYTQNLNNIRFDKIEGIDKKLGGCAFYPIGEIPQNIFDSICDMLEEYLY